VTLLPAPALSERAKRERGGERKIAVGEREGRMERGEGGGDESGERGEEIGEEEGEKEQRVRKRETHHVVCVLIAFLLTVPRAPG